MKTKIRTKMKTKTKTKMKTKNSTWPRAAIDGQLSLT